MTTNLADLWPDEIRDYLESYEFFSPARDYTYTNHKGEQVTHHYEARTDSGWDMVEEYAGGDGYDLPIGHLTLIDSFGGEGQGDSYWMVLRLTQGDVERTFKMDGWYASHDGGYYDGPFTEVKPVQKMITVWE